MRKLFIGGIILLILILISFFFLSPFRAPGTDKTIQIFVLEASNNDVAGLKLEEKGFVRSVLGFEIARTLSGKKNDFQEGGYYLSKNMTAFDVASHLSRGPDLKWVKVLPGWRKEQIGEELHKIFGWSDSDLKNWNNTYTAMKFDYTEGVYFPDTYLIPVKEDGLQIANRMIAHFNEKMTPYAGEFAKKDIKWTTGVKVASLIQKESSGTDMKLISGIIWNRLLANQKLQIDATVQYAKGKTNGNWWPSVFGSDITNIDSSFNTYKHLGLPPTPIAEPSLDAIEAALNPAQTDCIYYLHDKSRQIHCSKTYEEHLTNIKKYLN